MSEKLSECLKVKEGIQNADITTDRTSPWHEFHEGRRALGSLQTETVADTKVATIELLQAKDNAGDGAKNLAGPVTATSAGGQKLAAVVDAKQDALDDANGFSHIAVKVTCDNGSAVVGCAQIFIGDLYHKP